MHLKIKTQIVIFYIFSRSRQGMFSSQTVPKRMFWGSVENSAYPWEYFKSLFFHRNFYFSAIFSFLKLFIFLVILYIFHKPQNTAQKIWGNQAFTYTEGNVNVTSLKSGTARSTKYSFILIWSSVIQDTYRVSVTETALLATITF